MGNCSCMHGTHEEKQIEGEKSHYQSADLPVRKSIDAPIKKPSVASQPQQDPILNPVYLLTLQSVLRGFLARKQSKHAYLRPGPTRSPTGPRSASPPQGGSRAALLPGPRLLQPRYQKHPHSPGRLHLQQSQRFSLKSPQAGPSDDRELLSVHRRVELAERETGQGLADMEGRLRLRGPLDARQGQRQGQDDTQQRGRVRGRVGQR